MNISHLSKTTSEMSNGITRSAGSFEIVAGAGLFGLIGFGLDRLVGTFPLFLVLGVFLGFSITVYGVVLHYRQQMLSHSADRAEMSRQ